MKEQIVTGKKFRILADVTSRLWHVISFWTKAQDVEFNNGQNAQTTLGNITGISDSLTSTSSNVAASAKAVKALNDKIVNQVNNLNDQLNQKNQAINNLNGQISQKKQEIENLNKKLMAGSAQSVNVYNSDVALPGDIIIYGLWERNGKACYPHWNFTEVSGNNDPPNGLEIVDRHIFHSGDYHHWVGVYKVITSGNPGDGFVIPNAADKLSNGQIQIGFNDTVHADDIIFLYHWNNEGFAYYPKINNSVNLNNVRQINQLSNAGDNIYRFTAYKVQDTLSFTGGVSIHIS